AHAGADGARSRGAALARSAGAVRARRQRGAAMSDAATQSLSRVLRESIARHAAADRTALVGKFGAVTYARLGELVDGFASAASGWGVGRGELVGIAAGRSPETVALFFGLMQAGACPCVMEPKLSADNVVLRMRAVGMKRLVVDRENVALGHEIAAQRVA